jgi:Ni,Fe-hydrogenase III large subunit/Ni,Fe-hydrogenase III component G
MSPQRTGGVRESPPRVAHQVGRAELVDQAAALLRRGLRLALVAAHDDGPLLRIVYLFLAGHPEQRIELHTRVARENPRLPSLAGLSFPASRFEREIADLFGVTVDGHPAPKRLVRHAHWPADWHPMLHDAGPPPAFPDGAGYPFTEVHGPGVYEIPVGPVHAGLIEPGHFRFSVVGETIIKMTARLWFLHRGIEKLFEGRAATGAVDLAERISGDTSAGHALAHTLAVEDALGIPVSDDLHRLRALLIELERLYNHAADIGALANDVGYGIANSHALHIREQLMRINHTVTGHRLLRTAIAPGAVALRALPDPDQLRAIGADLAELTELTLANSTVQDRFTGTAVLTAEQARELGCLGYVARASGLHTDARLEHPTVALPVRTAHAPGGDVRARYLIRRDEFAASVELACRLIEHDYPALSIRTDPRPVTPHANGSRSGIGIVEGWRGTIVHRIELGEPGQITRAKIVDPSWYNWPALPVALADTIVPDFPLANKSFNLSYAGNDL